MKFFNRKKHLDNKTNSTIAELTNPIINMNERPRICCIDIKTDIVQSLIEEGYNIFNATLGKQIKIPNKNKHDKCNVILNYDFPDNIHEFDIFLIDLGNVNQINYIPEDHIRNNHTGKSADTLLCSYPETLFDPRPLSSSILNLRLAQIGERNHMILAFTAGDYEVEYETVRITEEGTDRQGVENHGIYSFTDYIPLSESKFGKEMSVCDVRDDLKNLLTKYINKSLYHQTFHHPIKRVDEKEEPDEKYIPLVKNSSGDIVSIWEQRENSLNFYFPQINDKYNFLSEFLKNIAPDISPDLFPFSTTFTWKENIEYWLPNHKILIEEKEQIIKDYELRLFQQDKTINENKEKYAFLHEILTETGDVLVNATVEFLKWLGFCNAVNTDDLKLNGQVLEEDIQIEIEKGLIIIECKGIGGTSTDADCSQISKIKHRRCEQRNKFDVFALYLVNHQRYLPPLQRNNPPFNKIQIQDAINDARGLLTTWQLFNLYFEIENGIISKEEARNSLFKFGLIEFKPSNIVFIDEPLKFYKNSKVCIINIHGIQLKLGDEILIEKNGQFKKAIIEGIQADSKPINECSDGEFGINLNIPVNKNSKLWKKISR